MIDDTAIGTIDNTNTNISVVVSNRVKLQIEVSLPTKNYLRIEAIRRQLTMGQLLDEIM
jgi:hypothetical protein